MAHIKARHKSHHESHRLPLMALLLAGVIASPSAAGECPPDVRARLAGSWEWVRAEGGLVGGIYGPADWGYTQQFVFTSEGTVIEYRDNHERARSTYALDCADGETTLTCPVTEPAVMPLSDCGPYVVAFGEEAGQPTIVLSVRICADWYTFTYASRGIVTDGATSWGVVKGSFR